MKTIAQNRRARFDYQIEEMIEAGIVLTGAEVKSVRAGHVSLKGSYVVIKNNEAWLVGAQITAYRNAPEASHEPYRDKKLLLKNSQIKSLIKQKQNGKFIVPVAIGIQRNWLKLVIGIGPSKKKIDKRNVIQKREETREIGRIMKHGRQ